MATWRELSLDSVQAAQKLFAEGHWRSSVSRSYYGAYCDVCDRLVERGIHFTHGWNNPTHEQLTPLIQGTLPLALDARRQLTRAMRRLRKAREDADYRPGHEVDRALALACIHDAILVIQTLERAR